MHYVYLATDHRGYSWPMLTNAPRVASPECNTHLEIHTVTEDRVAAWVAWKDLLTQVQAQDAARLLREGGIR